MATISNERLKELTTLVGEVSGLQDTFDAVLATLATKQEQFTKTRARVDAFAGTLHCVIALWRQVGPQESRTKLVSQTMVQVEAFQVAKALKDLMKQAAEGRGCYAAP